VLYYAVLFILPLAVGVAPLAYFGLVPWTTVPLVFVTAAGMFTLGVALSLFLVGVYTRSRLAALLVTAAVVAGLVLRGPAVIAVTPYQLVSRVTPGPVWCRSIRSTISRDPIDSPARIISSTTAPLGSTMRIVGSWRE